MKFLLKKKGQIKIIIEVKSKPKASFAKGLKWKLYLKKAKTLFQPKNNFVAITEKKTKQTARCMLTL